MLYDYVTSVIMKWRGKAGAAHVINCDADGVPITAPVEVTMDETRVNNLQVDAIPVRLIDELDAHFGTAANPLNVNITDASVVVSAVAPANQASGQVVASVTAGTLVAARATRVSVLVRNLDTAISVYVGPATVSASNGMLLRAGESFSVDSTALIQVIAASGTPTVAYYETYA